MDFTVDYSKWRSGNNGLESTGTGETSLLNEEGFMCCLGQVTLQICPKLTSADIMCFESPAEFADKAKKPINFLTDKKRLWMHTSLANHAMRINDDNNMDVRTRMALLSDLFKENGHTLKFINVPEEFSK